MLRYDKEGNKDLLEEARNICVNMFEEQKGKWHNHDIKEIDV